MLNNTHGPWEFRPPHLRHGRNCGNRKNIEPMENLVERLRFDATNHGPFGKFHPKISANFQRKLA